MNSTILVGLQFVLIAAIVVLGNTPDTPMTILLFAAGCALGLLAIYFMQPDNLRIFPEPKKDIRFITNGPYKMVRHPMYTSVLTLMAAFIFGGEWYLLALWIILFLVFHQKIRIEERLLSERLQSYGEYQKQTWKLLPYIY